MQGREVFSALIDIGSDIMSAVLDSTTKAILLQLGDSTTGTATANRAELFQQAGFASMPAAPTQGSASCQSVAIKTPRGPIIIATRDTRASSIYGSLKPGETCVYATTGMARVLLKKSGSITLYTTDDNTASGVSITASLSPDGFAVHTPWGAIVLDSNGITLASQGGASLTLDASGTAKLNGMRVAVQGSMAALSGTVGTFLGPNATPNPAQAANFGPAGTVHGASTTVYISP